MSYSPVLGRFLQRDPLGYVDGGSLYQYEQSNSPALLDPMGFAAGMSPVAGPTTGPTTGPTEWVFTPNPIGQQKPVYDAKEGFWEGGLTTPHPGPMKVNTKPFIGKDGKIYGETTLKGWYFTADYWWTDSKSKAHEETHVSIWKKQFEKMKGFMKGFDGTACEWKQAACLFDALNLFKEWVILEGNALNLDYDATDYASHAPPAIVQKKQAQAAAAKAKANAFYQALLKKYNSCFGK